MKPAREGLVGRLLARARELYIGPVSKLCLDLQATDSIEGGRLLFGQTLDWIDDARHIPAEARSARLRLPTAALEWLLARPHDLDLRHAEFVRLCEGRIDMSGDRFVVEYFLQLLKRPAAATVAVLAQSVALAPGTLSRVQQASIGAASHTIATTLVRRAIVHCAPLLLRKSVACDRLARQELLKDAASGDYTAGTPAPAALIELVEWPALEAAALAGAQVWAGRATAGALTRLHRDPMTSMLAQLVGIKHVLLFSPRDQRWLYPIDSFNSFQPCRVDPRNPDLDRFPDFACARPLEVSLAPGDLLVIPTGWFHYVWARDAVVSVSRFVDDARVALASTCTP